MKRRDFLKRASLSIAGVVAGIQCGQKKENNPNIIIVIADDIGWNDIGYHNPEIKTPVLDRLAKENVELDRFYVYPVCSPTRASLLGGRPPSRWGILGPIAGKSRQALPHESPTIAQVLKTAGYKTAIAGKWHLGLRPDVGPKQYGFDSTYGYLHGQIDPYTHHYKNGDRSWHRNDEFMTEKGHATDLIRDEAVRVINEWGGGSQPFFLYVAFSVPHYPLDEPDKYVKPYDESITNHSRKLFAASMTHMDEAIGDMLVALHEKRIDKDTLFVFISDNGGQESWTPSTEYAHKFAANDVLGDNRSLRGWKGDLFEGGIRVPGIVSWPDTLKAGKCEQSIIVFDFLTTVAALLGLETKSEWKYEGIDVWPALSGKGELEERPLYWRSNSTLALRIGKWKLIHFGTSPDAGHDELYNVIDDPGETREVAAQHPGIVAGLKKELVKQFGMDSI